MSVTWNSSTITGPILIYHHEILRSASIDLASMIPSSALHCSSETNPGVTWHTPLGGIAATPMSLTLGFYQTKTNDTVTPSISVLVSRVGTTFFESPINNSDGLWSCRLNGASVAVGLYIYGRGECSLN